jgi:fructose-bisphosphate aldolase class II
VPVVPTRDIVRDALAGGYGVGAFNIVNDLTLEAVLAAAVEQRSPVIVQTSVKTVRSIGPRVLIAMWRAMTSGIEVPVSLHLDHCPDRQVVTECLEWGWNSVLFDASTLPVAENQRQTILVVEEAHRFGADVEGEIESITGVEDGIGSDEEAQRQDLDVALRFIRATGVDIFAPAIGNAHGVYTSAPRLDGQRVSDLVAGTGIPMALHGGTGLTDAQFQDLIARGCAKVNISTAVKRSYMSAALEHLVRAKQANVWDPPALFADTSAAVREMAASHMRRFGSANRAS